MSPYIDNEEFAGAFADLTFHHSPEDCDRLTEEMRHHPLAGRQAYVTVPDTTIINRRLVVDRADDRRVIFSLPPTGELILAGDERDCIRWI